MGDGRVMGNCEVFMLKKILLLFFIFASVFAGVFAEQSYTLKAGVSVVDKVPKEFYGTWRVSSTRASTNNEAIFKPSTVDLWNLSKSGNVITLENPFSGAKASIVVDEVNGKVIKFKKQGDYDNRKLTDVVQLQLNGDRFTGVNNLTLTTIGADGSVMKSERATYKLSGEKISGSSIK